MRAPFQILAIPYRVEGGEARFCVMRRADGEVWQFIAGGGEDAETPPEAARREIFEEGGLAVETLTALKSMCYIRSDIYKKAHALYWPKDLYVIPEYAFAFRCDGEPTLSREHDGYEWLPFDAAWERLAYDSNRTAMYETFCMIRDGRIT